MGKSKMFDIEWPDLGVKLTATMLEKEAPKICEAVWNALPFESVTAHHYVSGLAFGSPTQIHMPAIQENIISFDKRPVGTIALSTGFSCKMTIVYGKITEPMDTCVFAKVNEEDLKKLSELGLRFWRNVTGQEIDPSTGKYHRKALRVVYRKREV